MNDDKVFVDTNILVYAYDIDAGSKHTIAMNIIKDLWRFGLGMMSTQNLQEFFVIVTRKLKSPLDVPTVKEIIKSFSKWDVVTTDISIVFEAIELYERYKYSFWDSLIIASASSGGATTILSEDLADGQTIKNIAIKNPFK